MNSTLQHLRRDAVRILRGGVDAADPEALVARVLSRLDRPIPPYVVAAGKAASAMWRGAARHVRPVAGVLTSHDRPLDLPVGMLPYRGGHPAPTVESVAAGEHAVDLAAASRGRGGLLVLLSGGASAMLAAPVGEVTLADKLETARLLMRAGAAIDELNCVRKHLSRIKGGRLAAAARVTVTLALSDVHAPVADDPSVIGSGPTVPDGTTFRDAADILASYRVMPPLSVRRHLDAGLGGQAEETVKPNDPRLESSAYIVVGNRHTAVEGARRVAEESGYQTIVFEAVIAGEARQAGADFAERALAAAAGRHNVCVLGSGETTVTVRGPGKGGRNQEFALAAAAVLARAAGSAPSGVVASAGTDGVDGPTDAAGAIVDEGTSARAERAGCSVERALAENDAYSCLQRLGDLIAWGPTGTNVGDLHLLLLP